MTNDQPLPAMLKQELQVRNRQIAAVHAISGLLISTLDLNERMEHILQVCMDAAEAAAGTLFLHRPEDRKLVFTYVKGEKARDLTGVAIDDDFGVVGAVFHSGEGQITNRPKESTAHRADFGKEIGFTTESILTVPLMVQSGSPVGVIRLLNKRGGEFLPYDLEVLEIVAAISATAIENARLYDEAQVAAIAHRVGDLSHDIKNKFSPIPMGIQTLEPTILGMLEELESLAAEAPEEIGRRVTAATAAFRREYPVEFSMIMEQVDEVTNYTKLIADTLKGGVSAPAMERQDLSPIIERQIALLERAAKHRGVSLISELEAVPPFVFDRFRVETAVYNLVNNALPETPAGGSITVRTCGPDRAKFVSIEVRDTGRGMPEEKLQEVLRGAAKSDKPGGTGLGTRIIYKAVEDHKGRFEGESAPGVGTTFRMMLPFRDEA